MEKQFSVAAIPNLVNELTIAQRQILDEAWKYFIAFEKPLMARTLPSIIGKKSIQDTFKGMNGNLIYEKSEQDGHCFQITAYGALLTDHGPHLANLLVSLFDLIKSLYEKDSFIKSLDSSQIQIELGISDSDIRLLFKLLRLQLPPNMPFYVSMIGNDGTWTITITDEVIELYRSENSLEYLDIRLTSGYKSNEPCLYEERSKPSSMAAPFISANMFPAAHPHIYNQGEASYVHLSRIEALKNIQCTSFDCTRLISMCEELNECAARSNAHAVIMLTRAILDHVPPAFGYRSFKEVASNYDGGGSSFKKSTDRLENHSKKVADRLLHMPIRNKEVAPTMHEVSFASELETLLGEFCRILK